MQRKSLISFTLLLCMAVACSPVFADMTLGALAEELTLGATFLSRLMVAACYIVGIALLIIAATQYRIHCINPKLVPLMVPVTYIFLGLVLLALPQLGKYVAKTGSPLDEIRHRVEHRLSDIDRPLNK